MESVRLTDGLFHKVCLVSGFRYIWYIIDCLNGIGWGIIWLIITPRADPGFERQLRINKNRLGVAKIWATERPICWDFVKSPVSTIYIYIYIYIHIYNLSLTEVLVEQILPIDYFEYNPYIDWSWRKDTIWHHYVDYLCRLDMETFFSEILMTNNYFHSRKL